MTPDYSASIGDPDTGTIIADATVEDVNPLDGVLWKVEYEINDSQNVTYEIEQYVVWNDTPEYRWSTTLDPDENTVSERVGVPSAEKGVERNQLRIVRNETGKEPEVVDGINVTVRAD